MDQTGAVRETDNLENSGKIDIATVTDDYSHAFLLHHLSFHKSVSIF